MIPKEQQSAYQRWEMTSFGDERPSTVARRAAMAPPPAPAPAAAPEAGEFVPNVTLPTAEELEAIHEQARAEGYAEGLEAGRAAGHAEGYADGAAAGQQEASAELEHLRSIAATFSDAVVQADETIAHDVLELALRLARGMVRTAFDVRPELILPVVQEAIGYLPVLAQPATLTLNPDDAEIVRQAMGQELIKGGWRIVDDAGMARGGCKVDTASNQIDAQAAARWGRLTHALQGNVDWLGN
ncbi:flagellar assembly protein FliH [Massilia yuzhufengensis]|uniref:Flagellar assembly protein FliH n=1 Tax=Massilia yuzhufengensis TaxID=1164594 RepID=A0A1I1MKU7_9BURK|nr:flagellar assembly protein FliH [Massilia yuzhufengensis]SFC86039.1 flagellar assembly protein FliH [Massilia yuzhufengensis]